MGKDPSVWMQALRYHRYLGRPQYGPEDPESGGEGSVYLAPEDIVETLEILKFAKRVAAPPKAVRETAAPLTAPVTPVIAPVNDALAISTTNAPELQPRRRGRRQ